MKVRILSAPPFIMESLELKKFMIDVGNSVHSMNTIAVALSLLPDDNVATPASLNISWNPKNLEYSKILARNYAERSSYVYAAESLFEYLRTISKNALWNYPDQNFQGDEKKAIKVYKFLKVIPGVSETMAILCELLSHWRNRIVHLNTSNASISSSKRNHLIEERNNIYDNFYHFDIIEALTHYDKKKITLKDTSTLITISIKSARLVDEYFFKGVSKKEIENIEIELLKDKSFQKIIAQNESKKKTRQITKWININYPYLKNKISSKLINKVIQKSL